MNVRELTGQARSHIVEAADPACAAHRHALAPFLNLRRAAVADGFDPVPVSSFRDFDRQLAIWNAKFSGARPILDAAGDPLDAGRLSAAERVAAILRWSALPGASRHHWGTDFDLIDRKATAPGYRVQLTAAEFAPAGPAAPAGPYWPFAAWLDLHAARFGFFRPFRGIRSGVAPEPWHVSFAPIAENARHGLSCAVLRAVLVEAPILGKQQVLASLEELHARYVWRVDFP